MRVFLSHSSQDKPAAEQLARALRERGIECWLDRWEIGPGDDIVARINGGLDEADAGLIVFSRHSRDSRWVEAETSYLTYARIQEGKPLVPVVAGEDAWIPPLLRPLARRGIAEVEAIADALLSRRGGPPPVRRAELGRSERVTLRLLREGDVGLQLTVRLGEQEYVTASHSELPHAVAAGRDTFLKGFRTGVRRSPAAAERSALEASLAELGRSLRDLCLPADAGAALASLIDGSGVDTTVEVCFEADDPELLGLPFEALRLPDDRLLATLPSVVVLRRPAALSAGERAPMAGPIKILVAVGAPDEERTSNVVLDQERELQTILDAVAAAQRLENVEVRFLEVGHPAEIGEAVERDAYHVLHLSCHAMPGRLELEDEDGRAVLTTAAELLTPLRKAGRPLPVVFLNACHGGVESGQTASFAEELLRAGVPCVLAMQTSVSDRYATRLAGAFYEHLARREPPLASRALAAARQELEADRLRALQQGEAPLGETWPEYATATLFVAGEEPALADFSLDSQPLRERSVHDLAGPVPQLRMDDLIGRRKELRATLRTLRDDQRRHAGVVLTGIGGVGKSAVAGRAMRRLVEGGWMVPAHVGRFDLQAIAIAIGSAFATAPRPESRKRAALLVDRELDDRLRLQLLAQTLAEEPIVLVLDDFEQNLEPGGGAFRDPDVASYLGLLAASTRRGRLLVTSRYPLPNEDAPLRRIAIGPLSLAETRKLLLRLPALQGRAPAELAQVLRVIGGHPRMLEFLDGVLRGGEGRLAHVTRKLRAVLDDAGIAIGNAVVDLDEGLQQVLLLGARDVLLEELLELARHEGTEEVLLQAAVSNLSTSAAGLAHMLAGEPADVSVVERGLERLEQLSFVYRFEDGSAWVHRWTAEGLARLSEPEAHRERCNRAGRYRWWRVANESHDLWDGEEAVRNHLVGQDFDSATQIAFACFEALRRFRQSAHTAAFASEVLESLPVEHADYAAIADEEAQAHLALGLTERALNRYGKLLERYQQKCRENPDRADYQHDLSVLHERIGDLQGALGQGEAARAAYERSLAISERLASAEPDRADYQRDLSASYNRLGILYRQAGQEGEAREAFLKDLAIAERLARAEPERADYQVDLAISLRTTAAFSNREEARSRLARARSILEDLATGGRLAPADQPRLAAVIADLEALS